MGRRKKEAPEIHCETISFAAEHLFLQKGIELGDFRRDIKIMPTIFSFWGMLSGLIQTAEKKENYIKQEFLAYGFDMLYYSIANREETK